MTIDEAVAQCDRVKPNQYPKSEKIRWLSQLDGTIQKEILDYYEAGEFAGYGEDTPGETELLAPEAYTGIYEAYLSAQVDFHNGEFSRYQNSAQLYNTILSALAAWFRRTRMPLQENSIRCQF